MTSDRVYRKSPGIDYAIKEIEQNAGTQFDPEIAEEFLSVLKTMTPESIVADYLSKGSNQVTFS